MLTKTRQHVSRMLTGCCVVLWLTGLLPVGQANLTAQGVAAHCPQGQTHSGQHHHNHCAWHCGGFDIQGGGGGSDNSADGEVSLVWILGSIPLQDAILDGQFPPRGPPQTDFEIA